MVTAIIVAAGKGTRMNVTENKVFLLLDGITILEHTVNAFLKCSLIDEIIIVTGKDDIERCNLIFSDKEKPIRVVSGGDTRQKSVYNGIKNASGDIVVIHDGARMLILPSEIENSIKECEIYDAVALGVPAKDTIKILDENGFVKITPPREVTYQIQTPQVFKTELIKNAHEKFIDEEATDDCMLAEKYGVQVKIIKGNYENIKITTPEDLIITQGIINKRKEKCE